MKLPVFSHRSMSRASVRLFIIALFLMLCNACQEPADLFPPVKYLYGGEQEGNGFQMWIWIFEDESIPALVRSGKCRYLQNEFIDTDEERLICRITQGGFTLSDPTTGNVLYTAAYIQKPYLDLASHAFHVQITWAHSPGATWDEYAEEMGWQREMDLSLQIDGDDIVY